MYYKEDWQEAKQRLEAFWKHQNTDRPCMAVFSPRENDSATFPELNNGPWTGGLDAMQGNQEQIDAWWCDPVQNYERMIFWFENTYFGGEAVPATYVNWGAMAQASFYGATPNFNTKSVWYPEVIRDWDTWQWTFDRETDRYWNTIKQIVRYLAEHANGRYFVGMPELGNAADILSLMRGMDNLAIDCLEEQEHVIRAREILGNDWVWLHEQLTQLMGNVNDGGCVLPWMSMWAPGNIDQLACDFSSVISPAMFKELFFPDIKRMGSWTQYGMYHLDGPYCMKNHLDVLLELDCIACIEFTPGAGSPPTLSEHYLPEYKKILDSGKNLYLLAEPHEVQPLCEQLGSEGLFLCTWAQSREKADALLQSAETWSKRAPAK